MPVPPSNPDREAASAYWKSIQDENGVDLTLIRASLRLTPEQRLERADAARRQVLYLHTHARRADANPPAPPRR